MTSRNKLMTSQMLLITSCLLIFVTMVTIIDAETHPNLGKTQTRHVLALLHGKAARWGKEVDIARRSVDVLQDTLRRELEACNSEVELIDQTASNIMTFFGGWVNSLRKRTRSIERRVGKLTVRQVAFQAYYTSDDDADADADAEYKDYFNPEIPSFREGLRFSRCDLNIAKAYDPKTGIFKAPTRGIYFLAVRVCTAQRKGAVLWEIWREPASNLTEPHMIARAESLSLRQNRDSVIASTMTKLEAGDEVLVRSGLGTRSRIYIQGDTWFMGVLLRPRVTQPVMQPRMLPMPGGFGFGFDPADEPPPEPMPWVFGDTTVTDTPKITEDPKNTQATPVDSNNNPPIPPINEANSTIFSPSGDAKNTTPPSNDSQNPPPMPMLRNRIMPLPPMPPINTDEKSTTPPSDGSQNPPPMMGNRMMPIPSPMMRNRMMPLPPNPPIKTDAKSTPPPSGDAKIN